VNLGVREDRAAPPDAPHTPVTSFETGIVVAIPLGGVNFPANVLLNRERRNREIATLLVDTLPELREIIGTLAPLESRTTFSNAFVRRMLTCASTFLASIVDQARTHDQFSKNERHIAEIAAIGDELSGCVNYVRKITSRKMEYSEFTAYCAPLEIIYRLRSTAGAALSIVRTLSCGQIVTSSPLKTHAEVLEAIVVLQSQATEVKLTHNPQESNNRPSKTFSAHQRTPYSNKVAPDRESFVQCFKYHAFTHGFFAEELLVPIGPGLTLVPIDEYATWHIHNNPDRYGAYATLFSPRREVLRHPEALEMHALPHYRLEIRATEDFSLPQLFLGFSLVAARYLDQDQIELWDEVETVVSPWKGRNLSSPPDDAYYIEVFFEATENVDVLPPELVEATAEILLASGEPYPMEPHLTATLRSAARLQKAEDRLAIISAAIRVERPVYLDQYPMNYLREILGEKILYATGWGRLGSCQEIASALTNTCNLTGHPALYARGRCVDPKKCDRFMDGPGHAQVCLIGSEQLMLDPTLVTDSSASPDYFQISELGPELATQDPEFITARVKERIVAWRHAATSTQAEPKRKEHKTRRKVSASFEKMQGHNCIDSVSGRIKSSAKAVAVLARILQSDELALALRDASPAQGLAKTTKLLTAFIRCKWLDPPEHLLRLAQDINLPRELVSQCATTLVDAVRCMSARSDDVLSRHLSTARIHQAFVKAGGRIQSLEWLAPIISQIPLSERSDSALAGFYSYLGSSIEAASHRSAKQLASSALFLKACLGVTLLKSNGDSIDNLHEHPAAVRHALRAVFDWFVCLSPETLNLKSIAVAGRALASSFCTILEACPDRDEIIHQILLHSHDFGDVYNGFRFLISFLSQTPVNLDRWFRVTTPEPDGVITLAPGIPELVFRGDLRFETIREHLRLCETFHAVPMLAGFDFSRTVETRLVRRWEGINPVQHPGLWQLLHLVIDSWKISATSAPNFDDVSCITFLNKQGALSSLALSTLSLLDEEECAFEVISNGTFELDDQDDGSISLRCCFGKVMGELLLEQESVLCFLAACAEQMPQLPLLTRQSVAVMSYIARNDEKTYTLYESWQSFAFQFPAIFWQFAHAILGEEDLEDNFSRTIRLWELRQTEGLLLTNQLCLAAGLTTCHEPSSDDAQTGYRTFFGTMNAIVRPGYLSGSAQEVQDAIEGLLEETPLRFKDLPDGVPTWLVSALSLCDRFDFQLTDDNGEHLVTIDTPIPRRALEDPDDAVIRTILGAIEIGQSGIQQETLMENIDGTVELVHRYLLERVTYSTTYSNNSTLGKKSKSKRHDRSPIEFSHHRDYQTGDEVRSIDFKVLGRSDRLKVKEFDGNRQDASIHFHRDLRKLFQLDQIAATVADIVRCRRAGRECSIAIAVPSGAIPWFAVRRSPFFKLARESEVQFIRTLVTEILKLSCSYEELEDFSYSVRRQESNAGRKARQPRFRADYVDFV